MMHHRAKTDRRKLWLVMQLIAWGTVMAAVLVFVTGCKSDEPAPRQRQGPTFVREPLHSMCGRCFDRPELGHAP